MYADSFLKGLNAPKKHKVTAVFHEDTTGASLLTAAPLQHAKRTLLTTNFEPATPHITANDMSTPVPTSIPINRAICPECTPDCNTSRLCQASTGGTVSAVRGFFFKETCAVVVQALAVMSGTSHWGRGNSGLGQGMEILRRDDMIFVSGSIVAPFECPTSMRRL